MEDNTPKLEFFSDIKDKFFLILGGIISLTTIIPAFLNKTAEIFGLPISWGYFIFVAVYFVFPYVFYLLYCSIHDDVGFLELLPDRLLERLKKINGLKTTCELFFLFGIIYFLLYPAAWANIAISLLLYTTSLACFLYFLVNYWSRESLRKEFLIIGTVIIVVFGLFFFNTLRHSPERQIFSYSIAQQNAAFLAYDTKDTLQTQLISVMESVHKTAREYQLQAAIIEPRPVIPAAAMNDSSLYAIGILYRHIRQLQTDTLPGQLCVSENVKGLKVEADRMLSSDKRQLDEGGKNLYRVAIIDEAAANLYDYAVSVQQEKMTQITGQWAGLLKVLQFKSLIWFQFLILLGLSLWLKMQVRLAEIPNKNYAKIPLITDNLGQVKSLIFLLFVLILPWFRTIDAKDIELERPFLNISLSGLVSGTYQQPPMSDDNGEKGKKPDSLYLLTINNYPPGTSKPDPRLDKIDTAIIRTQELIREQARRTIGNTSDRRTFNDKKIMR